VIIWGKGDVPRPPMMRMDGLAAEGVGLAIEKRVWCCGNECGGASERGSAHLVCVGESRE
jgi:hypothetical protein